MSDVLPSEPRPGELPWEERMAREIYRLAVEDGKTLSIEGLRGVLEAAGELKAVRVRVLLGRVHEVCIDAHQHDHGPHYDDALRNEVLEALK